MLSDSDYAAVAATGGKVTAFCGFNWSSPDDEEEVEAEEKVVDNPRLSMEPVNPHHPRFLRSHLPASDVTPVVSSVSAPEVDERDFGEEEEEVESVERTRPTAAPHRPPFEPYESLQDQLARMRTLRAEVPSYAEAIMLQGSRLVDFAAAGNIIRIMEIVHGSEPGELLYWHSSKMFLAGCAGGHADVVRLLESCLLRSPPHVCACARVCR